VAMTVALAGGRNFISLRGGTGDIRYETLHVKMLGSTVTSYAIQVIPSLWSSLKFWILIYFLFEGA